MKKMIKTMFSVLGLICLTACNGPFGVSMEEIYRLPSPDGRVDAVLVEINGGATTDWLYRLHILPSGTPIPGTNEKSAAEAVLIANDVKNFSISWITNGVLEVQYDSATILQFRNTATVGEYKSPPWQVIEIRLSPQIAPHSVIAADLWNGTGNPPLTGNKTDRLKFTIGKANKAEPEVAPYR